MMSTLEMCTEMLHSVPEYKLGYVLAYLQGLAADAGNSGSFNDDTLEAIREVRMMKENPSTVKRYRSFREILAELDNEDKKSPFRQSDRKGLAIFT